MCFASRAFHILCGSYHDSAYDGVFQLSHGWGFVEAPAEFKAEILDILDDLKQTPPVP